MLLLLLSDWIRTEKCGVFSDLEQKAVQGRVQWRQKCSLQISRCAFPGFIATLETLER